MSEVLEKVEEVELMSKERFDKIMLKFLIPAVLIFLIVLFWEKINEIIYKKFNLKLNYLLLSITLLIIGAIYLLIKN